jgi:heptaprenyl diphosphate synthase
MTNQLDLHTKKNEYSYDVAFEKIKEEIERVLCKAPRIIREYTGHLNQSTGKLMRASSLLACSVNDASLVPQIAITLACAIEIIHLATLVHDDVIDDADIRRGIETLQKKYGNRTAVICGDYLLSVALKMVASAIDKDKEEFFDRKIPDFISKVCLGELHQQINNGNYDLSILKYLKIISGKTASMFEAAFFTGASLVEKDEIIIKKYCKIGHYVGMTFQLIDDCMDFETTIKIAKKPVQSDYEKNVITLPLIYTFGKINQFRERAKLSKLKKDTINKMVQKAGGISYTRSLAKKYNQKALNLLHHIDASKEKKKRIQFIINKAYRVFNY